jgi:hypothetical protein
MYLIGQSAVAELAPIFVATGAAAPGDEEVADKAAAAVVAAAEAEAFVCL